MITRRDTLFLALAGGSSLVFPGCSGSKPDYPDIPVSGGAIDIHCHLFNGTDLPVTRFLTQVVLSEHETRLDAVVTHATVVDPTIAERLIELLTRGLLRDTPNAVQETEFLQRRASKMVSGTLPGARQQVIERTAAFLEGSAGDGVVAHSDGDGTLRQQILDAAGMSRDAVAPTTSQEYTDIAEQAVTSNTGIGLLARWVALFFRYRHELADELAEATRANGREPRMLVPLMVDYAHWLGEDTAPGSSLTEQVVVFDHIARRRNETPVHGMVGYDPLRAVFFRRGTPYAGFSSVPFDPVALARSALTDHGFVGLKLYPPMGFRPIGNTDGQGYPRLVVERLGGTGGLGSALDAAMAEAFDLCTDLDAAILTHARYSIGAGPDYAARADPAFWVRVLKQPQWRGLRVCLAHMGYFRQWTGSSTAGADPDRRTWEWTAGRHIKENPDGNLYVDISYLTEVLSSGAAERRRIASSLRQWIDECDPDVGHVLYGTDWTMVGREPDFPRYTSEIAAFLSDDCGLDEAQLDRIMMGNAVRFLGLLPGDKTRLRLESFYEQHGLPLSRLPPPG